MSQNDQAEKSLFNRIVPYWWVCSSNAPYCMDWTLKYTPKTPTQLWHPKIPPRYTKTLPLTPQDIPKQHQTPQGKTRINLAHKYWWSGTRRSHHTTLAQPWNTRFVPAWFFWDIKIPRSPDISFPRIIVLCHFLYFLGSPERNHLWQLLWITP